MDLNIDRSFYELQDESALKLQREKVKSISVFYIHGLEGGKNRKKQRYLKECVETLTAPDLQMSLWDVRLSNSIARKALPNFILILVLLISILYIFIKELTIPVWGFAILFTSMIFFFILGVRFIIQSAIMKSLQSCAHIVTQQLNSLAQIGCTPNVVIGSSWGGAVLHWIIHHGIYAGPAILIAPALGRIAETQQNPQLLWRNLLILPKKVTRQIVIIHGDKDDIIPINHSYDFAQANPDVRFVIIPEATHRLNDALLQNGRLIKLIYQIQLNNRNNR